MRFDAPDCAIAQPQRICDPNNDRIHLYASQGSQTAAPRHWTNLNECGTAQVTLANQLAICRFTGGIPGQPAALVVSRSTTPEFVFMNTLIQPNLATGFSVPMVLDANGEINFSAPAPTAPFFAEVLFVTPAGELASTPMVEI